jgi:hypothetical protein
MDEKNLDSSQESPELEESEETSPTTDEKAIENETESADESLATEEPPQDQRAPESLEPPPVVEESRFRRFLRRTIRWGAGLLSVFALGVLTAILAFYLPSQRSLSQAEGERDRVQQRVEEVNAELDLEKDRADQRVADVEAEVDALSAQITSLAEEIQGLEGELSDSMLHVHILSALADVTSAQLALVQEDLDGARLALSNTPETLAALLDMVGDDQQDAVSAMQQRLTLVLGGMEEDPTTSRSDLGIMATNLLKLENTFFVEP